MAASLAPMLNPVVEQRKIFPLLPSVPANYVPPIDFIPKQKASVPVIPQEMPDIKKTFPAISDTTKTFLIVVGIIILMLYIFRQKR